jgi:hypothetical protein
MSTSPQQLHDQFDASIRDPKRVISFMEDYFRNHADIVVLYQDRTEIKISLRNMRGQIVKSNRLWEKLDMDVILARNPEGSTTLYLMYSGFQAPGVGSIGPASAAYREIIGSDRQVLKDYVSELVASLCAYLTAGQF